MSVERSDGRGEERGVDEGVHDVDVWFPLSVCFVMDLTDSVDLRLKM